VFRRHPDTTTDNYTDSHVGRGVDYDEQFDALPARARMWTMEQAVLRELIASTRASSVVDLACGTGRITGLLAEELPGARVVGLDVADSMLEVARRRLPDVTFAVADVRALDQVVPNGSVDLITAFRFFPNADPGLRADATDAICAALAPAGFLMLNNHRNFWSPSYVARRLAAGDSAPGARTGDIISPFLERGFRVVARRSLGVLPHTDAKTYLLPARVADRVEHVNRRRLSHLHAAGTNTIWLLARPAPRR
jgi:SAM-dependent methyltransferase